MRAEFHYLNEKMKAKVCSVYIEASLTNDCLVQVYKLDVQL